VADLQGIEEGQSMNGCMDGVVDHTSFIFKISTSEGETTGSAPRALEEAQMVRWDTLPTRCVVVWVRITVGDTPLCSPRRSVGSTTLLPLATTSCVQCPNHRI